MEAKADFERVLTLEPRNRQALDELKRLSISEVSNGAEGDGFTLGSLM